MNPGLRSRLLILAARIGPFWYAIPSALVVLAGLATCSLIDEPDRDRFEVIAATPHPSGVRSAVLARQTHADSGATVACVWVVAGPAPSRGPTRRLDGTCTLIATDPQAKLALRWMPNGRLGVTLPAGTVHTASEPLGDRCYFEIATLGRHVCYRPQLVQIIP